MPLHDNRLVMKKISKRREWVTEEKEDFSLGSW